MDITFDPADQEAANRFMSQIELHWKRDTGLTERSSYSIFYGPCVPSPLMVISSNPGGSPDDYKIVDVTQGEHEYIEGYGPTSQNTGLLLQQALDTSSAEGIRGVVGSNVIWHRSRRLAELKLSPLNAARETAPHLKKVVAYVKPRAIVFGGSKAFDLFVKTHDIRSSEQREAVMGPNGSHDAVFFARSLVKLPYLETAVEAFTVFHPSKGLRAEAVNRLRWHLQRLFAN